MTSSMTTEMLYQHQFQFISHCYVYHTQQCGGSVNINDDTHVMHVTKGNAILVVDKKTYRIKRGCVIAIPPFVKFTFQIEPEYEMRNLHIKLRNRNGYFMEEQCRLPFVFQPKQFVEIETKLIELQKLSDEKPIWFEFKMAQIAYDIILTHIMNQDMVSVLNGLAIDDRIERLRNYLQANCRGTFHADALARMCCLSKSQMNRKFQQYFKTSPRAYWEQHRYHYLCNQLLRESKTFSEIAEEAGFADNGHFSRWFKKQSGITPGEFRQNPFPLE